MNDNRFYTMEEALKERVYTSKQLFKVIDLEKVKDMIDKHIVNLITILI